MTTTVYNDGGRNEAFGTHAAIEFAARGVNDCVARSLAIITGKPYAQIWQRIADINLRAGKKHSANHRCNTGTIEFRAYANELGLEWVQPVQGRFKDMAFPSRCMVHMNGHYTAVIDGVIYDTHNPTPAGMAHVFGWWIMKPQADALYDVISEATGVKVNIAPLSLACAETMQRLMRNNYNKYTTLKIHE